MISQSKGHVAPSGMSAAPPSQGSKHVYVKAPPASSTTNNAKIGSSYIPETSPNNINGAIRLKTAAGGAKPI